MKRLLTLRVILLYFHQISIILLFFVRKYNAKQNNKYLILLWISMLAHAGFKVIVKQATKGHLVDYKYQGHSYSA